MVTSVPDEMKGEKLVVLYTGDEAQIEGLRDKLAAAGLPNLWIPRQSNFFKVEELPVLGSGKLDLSGIRKKALELVDESSAVASTS